MRLPKVGDIYYTCISFINDDGDADVEISEWSAAYRGSSLIFSHVEDAERYMKVESKIWEESPPEKACFKRTAEKAVLFERARLSRERRALKKQHIKVRELKTKLDGVVEVSRQPLGDKLEKALTEKDEDNT